MIRKNEDNFGDLDREVCEQRVREMVRLNENEQEIKLVKRVNCICRIWVTKNKNLFQ